MKNFTKDTRVYILIAVIKTLHEAGYDAEEIGEKIAEAQECLDAVSPTRS